MTIEIIGGEVVAQTKSKGAKRKTADAPAESSATGTQPAPATRKGRRKATTGEATSEPAAPTEPAPSRRRKKAAPVEAAPDVPASLNAVTPGHDAKLPEEPPEFTLADLAAGYLQHLEASGKSQGTIASYSLELAVAMDELGKDTPVSQLTAERVKAFFESERVTKTRSGRTKSPLSIAKTRRVLSQAIRWGVERGRSLMRRSRPSAERSAPQLHPNPLRNRRRACNSLSLDSTCLAHQLLLGEPKRRARRALRGNAPCARSARLGLPRSAAHARTSRT